MNVEDEAVSIIKEAIKLFGIDNIAISFNGGKDCTVMLDILYKQFKLSNPSFKLKAVYIQSKDTFPELEEFISKSEMKYDLDLMTIQNTMKSGLQEYLNRTKVKAICVGIRKGDPTGKNLQFIQQTDEGWPDFYRIHPILNWTFSDIWDYLLKNHLEYCKLYDAGYTSLGDKSKTSPNPNLVCKGKVMGAYALQNEVEERLGRQ